MKRLLFFAGILSVLWLSPAFAAPDPDHDADRGVADFPTLTSLAADDFILLSDTSNSNRFSKILQSNFRAAIGLGVNDNPSFNSVHASGGNLAAANAQVTKKWITGLSYTADVTSVIHGGKHYICISNHTAGSSTEPDVGVSWETVWKPAGDGVFVYGDNTLYTQDSEPAACLTGDMWVDTNGTSGQRIYTCESANTWVAQAGGSGDDLGSAAASDVVALFNTGTCSGYLKSDGTCDSPTGTGDMVLATAQTVTGKKTFENSDLALLGSSTGATTFASANAGATDYTLTFPAVTATVLAGVPTADNQILQATGVGTYAWTSTLEGVGNITGGTYNNITVTAPATGATLTLSDSSSLITVGGDSITLNTTAATDVTLPTSGTLATQTWAQQADSDLTTWAGVTPSSNGQSLVAAANYAAMRGLLDLEADTDFAAYGKNPVVIARKATTYTIGTDSANELFGGTIYVTSATTITAPAVAAGQNFTVVTIGDIAVSLDVNAADKMILDGVTLADGDKATNTSKAGDTITCQYYSADGFYCWSGTVLGGHWTDGN